MKYNYTILAKNEKQYENYDFTENNIVDAVYVKSSIPEYNVNPYIEALPQPRNENECFLAYNKSICGYEYDKVHNLSRYEKLSNIALLKKVRFILPFHQEIEDNFYLSLINSYNERRPRIFSGNPNCLAVQNSLPDNHCKLISRGNTASNAGFTLLGFSGCGKSAAIEILLSNYPQVIEHYFDDVGKVTQIVYINVVCPANSNFKALYESIGEEIDKALGYSQPFYFEKVRKASSIGQKANVVCNLIELFGIGAIIFDEIQLLDFSSQKESSFESLLTIVNKTKVALITVGTEDAYEKMFPNFRTSRRTGALIKASSYCEDKSYFSHLATQLLSYQWYDTFVEPTEDMISTLYETTKGVIAMMIGICFYMQIDYIQAKRKPTVNAEYIYRISEKYYPGSKRFLNKLNFIDAQLYMQEQLKNAEDILSNLKYEESKKSILDKYESPELKNISLLKDKIMKNIQNIITVTGDVYNTQTIENATNQVLSKSANIKLSEEELTKKVYNKLKTKKSDKRPTTPKKAIMDQQHINIKNSLLGLDA